GGVEPNQQSGIAHDLIEQRPKPSSAQLAKELILAMHGRQIADLLIAGSEVVVPNERQPLAQRIGPKEHAVDPPRLEPASILRCQGPLRQQAGRLCEMLRHSLQPALARKQAIDTGCRSVRQVALKLLPGCAKASPAMEVDHTAEVPRRLSRGDVRRP